ncbi:MAG: AAA family ATPase [Cyanobacteria bacterium P01_G01_bin.39]
MEKIEIKDFVGIKDISIEVKQINILIGPQASGKSIIAKLLYFFKDFIFEIINAALLFESKRDLDKELKLKFREYFPVSSWGKENFKVRYSLDEEFIEISRKLSKKQHSSIVLKYSDLYKDALTELRDFAKREKKKELEQTDRLGLQSQMQLDYDIKRAFLLVLAKENKNAAFEQLYIPAGRSFFAYLKNTIFAFLSESNAVDPFLADFGTFYENVKLPMSLEIIKDAALEQKQLSKEISLLNDKILCGKYLKKNGEDYLQLAEGRTIEVANSSSGQQETLPLIIILRRLAFVPLGISGSSIYIEEPEAHIFPAAQKNIVELISTVYNARKHNLQFFITTHSPYILTAFNNLIQAGILAEDATEKKIEQISQHVPKTRFLHPDKVAVYSLENGYCKSIIDQETGLIDASIIDEVSNELAIQFDELLDLEE